MNESGLNNNLSQNQVSITEEEEEEDTTEGNRRSCTTNVIAKYESEPFLIN